MSCLVDTTCSGQAFSMRNPGTDLSSMSYAQSKKGDLDDDSQKQPYSQWQQWSQSRRTTRRPRLWTRRNDLLSEYVDPREQEHMSLPSDQSVSQSYDDETVVEQHASTVKPAPVSPFSRSNQQSSHVLDSRNYYSGPKSPGTATTTTEMSHWSNYRQGGEATDSFEVEQSAYGGNAIGNNCDSYSSLDYKSVVRKTSTGGPNSPARAFMEDALEQNPLLRATSSVVQQQEAIMQDIQQRAVEQQRSVARVPVSNSAASTNAYAAPPLWNHEQDESKKNESHAKDGKATQEIPTNGWLQGRRVRILDQSRVQHAVCRGDAVVVVCISCQKDLLVATDRSIIYCPECGALVPADFANKRVVPDDGRF